MEVEICAWMILFTTFAHNLWGIEGNQSFFADFLKYFDSDNPIFICSDQFELDIATISINSTTGFVRYVLDKEEALVLHQLHEQFLLGDFTMVVFINDGHRKLLDQLINDLQLFNKGLRGLISEFDKTMDFSFTLHLDTQLYIYAPEGETIILKEAYGVNGYTKVETIGTWKESTGLIVPTPSIWERRSNLEGRSIRVATMSFPPMQNLYYDTSGQSIIGCGGLFLDPINILACKLNFTVNFILPSDGTWGALTKNGTWTGMIGMLIKDEVDIAAADLSATEARQRVVEFSSAIAEEVVTLVAAPSGETEANSWIYFEIFPYSVWYLCCGMMLILSTFFYMVDSTGINVLHGQFDSEKFSFMNGMGLSLMFFRQIYYNVNIKCKSTKLLFILSALSTYLLYIHYVAYLTAASTHTKTNKISSFWDVISGEYQVSVWKYGVFHDLLRYAKRGTAMGEVYHKTMKNRPSAFIESIVDLRKLLASRKTSKKTLIYAGDLYLKSQYENLQYLNIQEKIRTPLAWAFQRDSDLIPIFNYHLYKMKQTGVIDRLRQNALGDDDIDATTSKTLVDTNGLGYENVLFPFIAFLTGVSVAVLLLGIEKAANFLKKCTKEEQQLNEDKLEEAQDIIDDIYDLLMKNHGKLGGTKFLSQIRKFSTVPDSRP